MEATDNNKDDDSVNLALSNINFVQGGTTRTATSTIQQTNQNDTTDNFSVSSGDPNSPSTAADNNTATNQIRLFQDSDTNNNDTPPAPVLVVATNTIVATTARSASTQSKKRKKIDQQMKCRRGVRVKVTRANLFHILPLSNEEQRKCCEGFGNNRYLYGKIVSGSGKQGYKINFDDFPVGNNEVTLFRKHLKVVMPNEEEVEYDHPPQPGTPTVIASPPAANTRNTKRCTDSFATLDNDVLKSIRQYVHQWGTNPDEVITWEILADNEHVTECPLKVPNGLDIKKTININEEEDNLNEIFFEHFFPSLVGHAKIIDKFHSDTKSPYHLTVRNDNVTFHDDDAEDCDWKVKVCYSILIAGSSELHKGVENLWKKGRGRGRSMYPDFGRYMPVNYFKAFVNAAPYCWSDPKHWFTAKRDKPWEIFLPLLQEMNKMRAQLFDVNLLMMDESMSGWRPKTSKLGGLPNYTYEPRKPVPLGTMFRNSVECISGCLIYQDVVQLPEVQHRKDFYELPSSLPGNQEIKSHTAEVLRQVEGSGLKQGGWVGGDAWFGSVMTCVEVWKRFGVYSTFIIKNNSNMFPMQQMFAVLKARYGNKPAGHWVVFQTEISGLKLFALAYAWSQRSVAYMVSSCGKTTSHELKYLTHFEDEFGNVQFKEIERPSVAHFLFEYLPLIDEHNKQRQSILNLERCWLTKDPWFRLLTTVLGMSVVDCHRWHRHIRYMKRQGEGLQISLRHAQQFAEDGKEELSIREFSDILTAMLENATRRRVASRNSVAVSNDRSELERILNKEGSQTRKPTPRQIETGRIFGSAITQNCYICRKYLKADGQVDYRETSWRCTTCMMPLCKNDEHITNGNRIESCLSEHLTSDDIDVGCFLCTTAYRPGKAFPKDKQINLCPRRSQRVSR
jgi:hypothetical protein